MVSLVAQGSNIMAVSPAAHALRQEQRPVSIVYADDVDVVQRGFLESQPAWTLDQIAGLAFGVSSQQAM